MTWEMVLPFLAGIATVGGTVTSAIVVARVGARAKAAEVEESQEARLDKRTTDLLDRQDKRIEKLEIETGRLTGLVDMKDGVIAELRETIAQQGRTIDTLTRDNARLTERVGELEGRAGEGC